MTSTVYIAKNVYGGDGLGRLGDGRVVFVPGAWAGESVKAEIVEERRHFVKARLVSVDEPSPERIDGGGLSEVPGCVYANLSPRGEVRAKDAQLREFFERARIVPGAWQGPADEPQPLNYRNKAVYHFGRSGGAWKIGYRAEPSHEIVDVTCDPLVVPAINQALPEIRRAITTLLTTGPVAVRRDTERKANVTVRWSARTGVKWWLGEAPRDVVLKETTCGRVFEVPAGGFYQVNPRVGDELVRAVVDACLREDTSELLDLYCGVGVFGLCCAAARPGLRLTGVESGRAAIDFARRNAAAQNVTARFFAEEVGRSQRRIAVGPQTTVIVDPPRGGLEPKVPDWLVSTRPARIFYVSCDPATLMRDLRILARAYDVRAVRWFNMFPRTARFESLVELKRKDA